ncbi:hypothetical protein A1359_20690 [Methylomonas lenta]|uniref:Uncharacterized protein n=1 Tax=Methylomonas lenta TaxID=980561 RepID=A0A177NRC2_9GAMM|nr:hypothetical protein [Methylomonas lenta]OAI20618.1 hypothetical protein A1359_20690 [Methylomonas lenta]
MNVKGEPSLPGLPSFGTLGFFAAVIGGIWLLISLSGAAAERNRRAWFRTDSCGLNWSQASSLWARSSPSESICSRPNGSSTGQIRRKSSAEREKQAAFIKRLYQYFTEL